MWRFLGYGVLFIVAIAAALVLLAWRAPEPPTTADALTSLPAAQRQALEALCEQAGLTTADLRLVFDDSGKLFGHALNRRAIVIQDGQLTALSLQDAAALRRIDLRAWPRLRALDLRGSGIAQWQALEGLAQLGALEHLNLSRTGLKEVDGLGQLAALRELDLSDTGVTRIDGLLALPLQRLDLSRTPLRELPPRLPARGDWQLRLDGTPLLQPAGYSARWPFGTWTSTSGPDADTGQGEIGQGRLDIQGQVQSLEAVAAVALPRTTDGQLAEVRIEARVASGRARIWLEEPASLFGAPWFTQGKVEGFGPMRPRGHVYVDVAPGQVVQLQGRLRLSTRSRHHERAPEHRKDGNRLPDWVHYHFFVEPLDKPVTGLRWRVQHWPARPAG